MLLKRKLRRFTHTALVKRNSGRVKAEEAAHDLIIQFNRFFFGFKGGGKLLSWARWAFPVISDTGCLKEIDHFFQDSLHLSAFETAAEQAGAVTHWISS